MIYISNETLRKRYMSDSSPLMIKHHFNSTKFLSMMQKKLLFVNEVYNHKEEIKVYYEIIEDGFISIYKDPASFYFLMNAGAQMSKSQIHLEFNLDDITIIEDFANPELMPPEGLIVRLEMITHPASELFDSLKLFYESMHPDTQVELIDETWVQITMKSFEAVVKHGIMMYKIAISAYEEEFQKSNGNL